MNKFNSDVPVQIPANSKEFMHRTESAFDILFRQTIATGVIAFAVVGMLGLVWSWTYTVRWAATFAALAMAGYWVIAIVGWRRDSHPDKPVVYPGDEPDSRRKMVHVRHDRVKKDGHYQVDEYDLPGDPEALKTLAQAILNGRPFTETIWSGKNRPFSYREFRKLRQLGLEKYGLFEYINPKEPKVGIQLTEKGRELFVELADGDMEEYDD